MGAWEEVSHHPPITEQRLGSRLSVSKAKMASRRVCQEVGTLTAQTGVMDAVVRADWGGAEMRGLTALRELAKRLWKGVGETDSSHAEARRWERARGAEGSEAGVEERRVRE